MAITLTIVMLNGLSCASDIMLLLIFLLGTELDGLHGKQD